MIGGQHFMTWRSNEPGSLHYQREGKALCSLWHYCVPSEAYTGTFQNTAANTFSAVEQTRLSCKNVRLLQQTWQLLVRHKPCVGGLSAATVALTGLAAAAASVTHAQQQAQRRHPDWVQHPPAVLLICRAVATSQGLALMLR